MLLIDVGSAIVRVYGLALASAEVRESRHDLTRAQQSAKNGSRLLLAKERLVGSGLSLVVQGLLSFSIIAIAIWRPMHDASTDLSLGIGTLVSVTLSAKALLTRAARRRIEREPT